MSETKPASSGWTIVATGPVDAPPVPSGPRCKRHPQAAASARCDRCRLHWCPFCVKQGEDRGVVYITCQCGGRCSPLENATAVAARRTFEQELVDAGTYPVRAEGRGILIVGALFVWMIDLFWGSSLRASLQSLRVIGSDYSAAAVSAGAAYAAAWSTVALLFVAGYLISHLMRVVHATGIGKDEPPGFPEFTSVVDSMALPLFRAVAALTVAFGPGVALLSLSGSVRLLGLPLLALGAIYLPMAVTAIAVSESLDGLNPVMVYRSIRRIPLHYSFAASIFHAALALLVFGMPLLFEIPYLGMPLRAALLLYLIVLSGRVLGLVYRHHREQLGWY